MMKTKDLPAVTSALIEKMKADGYSQARLEDTTWILEHFGRYCIRQGMGDVTVPVAVQFVRESFGFDYYHTTSRFQTILRRPLLILFEFHEFGNYKKTHQRGSTTQIPLIYEAVYLNILKNTASQNFPRSGTIRSMNTSPRWPAMRLQPCVSPGPTSGRHMTGCLRNGMSLFREDRCFL